MGLNDSFEKARGQILLMPNVPTINQAYAMVIQDESRRSIGSNFGNSGYNEPTSMFTAHSCNKPRRTYNLEC